METLDDNKLKLKKDWKIFNYLFMFLFWLKVITFVILKTESLNMVFVRASFFLQFVPIVCMPILVGWYAYKFSGKKLSMLYGLLGFLWFLFFSIFISYFVIDFQKNKRVCLLEK